MRDLALAFRRLWATPVFSAFATCSLAVGIGIAMTAYVLVSAAMAPAIAVPEAEAIGVVATVETAGRLRWQALATERDVLFLEQAVSPGRIASSVVAYGNLEVDAGGAMLVRAEGVSGGYFEILGQIPAVGRLLNEADQRDRSHTAVISQGLWTRLGRDQSVVGRSIRLDGQLLQIVGIVGSSFYGLSTAGLRTDLWLPASSAQASGLVDGDIDVRQFSVLVHQAPSIDRGRLEELVQAAGRRLDGQLLTTSTSLDQRADSRREWSVHPLEAIAGRSLPRQYAGVIFLLVCLFMAVTCSNLASLMVVRMARRTHEIGVRRALGASTPQLVKSLVAESAILVLAGSAVALGFATLFTRLVLATLSDVSGVSLSAPRLTLDTWVVGAMLPVISVLTFGLAPAMRSAKSVSGALASGASVVTGGQVGGRSLIRWQVAAAVCFLLIAAVCTQAVRTQTLRDPGVDLDHLVVAQLRVPQEGWDEFRIDAAIQAILASAARRASLDAAAVSEGLPFGLPSPLVRVRRPGSDAVAESAVAVSGTSRLLDTLGIPVLTGSTFDPSDWRASEPGVILSKTMSERVFADEISAVGEIVELEFPSSSGSRRAFVVVRGVAEDTDAVHLGSAGGVLYLPMGRRAARSLVLVGRTSGSPEAAVSALRAAVAEGAPEVAVESAGTGWARLGQAFAQARFAGQIALGLGGASMLLGAISLFAVLALSVEARRREFGVRLALGMTPGALRRDVLLRGVRPVAEGVTAGLLVGAGVRLLIRLTLDIDLPVLDVAGTATAVLSAALVACIACYVPAARAAALEPSQILRTS